MPQIVRYRTGGSAKRSYSFVCKTPLLRSEQFSAHFGKSFAKFRHFAAASGINRVDVVAPGQRSNARHEIIERMRDGTRNETEQQSRQRDGRHAKKNNGAIQ